MATIRNTVDLQNAIIASVYENTTEEITGQNLQDVLNDLAVSSINRVTDKPLLNLRDFDAARNGGYEVGEGVIYSNVIYKCTTAHTGAWNAANFTAITSAQALSDILANGNTTGAHYIIYSNLTADTVPYLNSSKELVSSSVSPTELSYLSGVTSPVQTQLNALQTGMFWKAAVRVATTTAGTLATSFENGDTVDGVTLVTGDRILIKDQAAATENGIYVINASGAPTRATDFDAGADNLAGATVSVQEGTTNGEKKFTCSTNNPITIGVTNIDFVEAGGTTYIGTSNRITITGNQIDISNSYVGQSTITTLGTITAGVWNGTAIDYNYIATMTSAQLAGIVSDETGYTSGALLVFNTSPTFTTSTATTATTATTNASDAFLTWTNNSSGTPAANYGVSRSVKLKSSTTNSQDAFLEKIYWSTATHATRKSDYALQLVHNGTLQDVLKIANTGSTHELQIIANTGNYATIQFYSSTTKKATFEAFNDFYLSTWTAGGTHYFRAGNAGAGMNLTTTQLTLDSGVNLKVGGAGAASAAIHVIKTSEQLRLGYDVNYYWKATTSSTGVTTFSTGGSGTQYFVFGKDVTNYGSGSVTSNTVYGIRSLTANTTGQTIVSFGYEALSTNTIGSSSSAFGYQALNTNLSGDDNSAFGKWALKNNSSGTGSTGIGSSSFQASTASYNTGIGYQSGLNTTSGGLNVAIGYAALRDNTTGARNTALGVASLYLSTVSDCVGIGYLSGNRNTLDSRLFIDNQDRTTAQDERNKSLIYGKFDASTANQFIVINGALYLQDTAAPNNYWKIVNTAGALVLTDTGSANAPT